MYNALVPPITKLGKVVRPSSISRTALYIRNSRSPRDSSFLVGLRSQLTEKKSKEECTLFRSTVTEIQIITFKLTTELSFQPRISGRIMSIRKHKLVMPSMLRHLFLILPIIFLSLLNASVHLINVRLAKSVATTLEKVSVIINSVGPVLTEDNISKMSSQNSGSGERTVSLGTLSSERFHSVR